MPKIILDRKLAGGRISDIPGGEEGLTSIIYWSDTDEAQARETKDTIKILVCTRSELPGHLTEFHPQRYFPGSEDVLTRAHEQSIQE